MSYKEMARRLEALEANSPTEMYGRSFVVDLGDDGEYLIDGVAVDPATFKRYAPDGAYTIDIGEDDDAL